MADGTDKKSAAKTGELFISRAGADKEIAILIAHILRDAGYTTFLQDENFGHTSFMACMREGFAKVDHGGRMVALLSKAYMQSDYCMAEADFALTGDPSNKKQRLIVLRIEDCVPTGFLKSIPWAYNLVPILHDATALGKAVSGAIDPAAPEANYAAGLKYAPVQILHPEIRPVPGFTGREDLLANLDRALWQKGGAAALTNAQSAAVHGLGGVGKSVLAQEYAWRNHARYRGVWSCDGTLIDDLIALGSLMPGLERPRARAPPSSPSTPSRRPARKALAAHLRQCRKALQMRARASHHHQPLARRRRARLASTLEMPRVSRARDRRARPDRDAAASPRRWAFCRSPSAMAAPIAPRAISASTPIARALRSGSRTCPTVRTIRAPLFATFSLAMDKAAAICPEAETLMGIAAFLAPDRIPLDIITADVIGEAELNKAVAALYNVSPDHPRDAGRRLARHQPAPAGAGGDARPAGGTRRGRERRRDRAPAGRRCVSVRRRATR